MCGIAGKISWHSTPSKALIHAMIDEMRLRGPDGEGLYANDHIVFGHRRLAIIDLTPLGRQPMLDHTGQYCITFNGEIYNFKEVRAELERLGSHFKTNSDTEVILEAYKSWGEECLSKLNGMFALAIWDNNRHSLFLARDRLGKKPLYYYQNDLGDLTFASELKALLKDPQIKVNIDEQALSQYLTLGYVLSNSCIISHVKKLPAAHCLTLTSEGQQLRRYWDLRPKFKDKLQIDEHEATTELARLIEDATAIRMISDVPLGAFLSGGIDSSAIVAMMSKVSGPNNVKTFSIGFEEAGYSELRQARQVAKLLNVSLREEVVHADMAQSLSEMVQLADEPFSDNSMIPTYYLSKFTRQEVTVALSGDGGDEVFSGYETYAADRWHSIFNGLPRSLISFVGKSLNSLLPVTHGKVSWDYKIRKFFEFAAKPLAEAHAGWRTIFSIEEQDALLNYQSLRTSSEYNPLGQAISLWHELDGVHYLDQAMYVDLNTWLVDDILVKADRMSMANSLEVRAPLLDYRIVEFAARLPVSLRMRGFNKKYILKKAVERHLPHEIVNRAKRGFNAPVAHWIDSGLKPLIDSIGSSNSRSQEIFKPKYLNNLIEQHRSKKADHSFRIFNILNFSLWYNSLSDSRSDKCLEVPASRPFKKRISSI